MSREFVDKLEAYWAQHGGRPSQDIVDWLWRSAVGTSEADRQLALKHVDPHLRKIEKTLMKIYVEEGEPEEKWLAILRRPGLMDLSDTLALTVIARWYAEDPMDQLVRFRLLAGSPMMKRTRPSQAYQGPLIPVMKKLSRVLSLLPIAGSLLIITLFYACAGAIIGGIIAMIRSVYLRGDIPTGKELLLAIQIGTLCGVIGLVRGIIKRSMYGKVASESSLKGVPNPIALADAHMRPTSTSLPPPLASRRPTKDPNYIICSVCGLEQWIGYQECQKCQAIFVTPPQETRHSSE